MADNETLVSWRFDVLNLFGICANRCAMTCAIWNQDQPIPAQLAKPNIPLWHKKRYQKMSSKSGPHFYIVFDKT